MTKGVVLTDIMNVQTPHRSTSNSQNTVLISASSDRHQPSQIIRLPRIYNLHATDRGLHEPSRTRFFDKGIPVPSKQQLVPNMGVDIEAMCEPANQAVDRSTRSHPSRQQLRGIRLRSSGHV